MNPNDMTTQADQKADESLPRYEQVKHLILKDIQHRQLKPGDRLPTEAELCRQFGWSRLTIGRAMNDLVTMGVLTRVRGSGTYVAAPKMDRPPRILISDLALRPEGGYSGPIFAGIRDIAGLEKLDLAHYYDAGIPEPQAVLDSKADGVLLLAPQVEGVV